MMGYDGQLNLRCNAYYTRLTYPTLILQTNIDNDFNNYQFAVTHRLQSFLLLLKFIL